MQSTIQEKYDAIGGEQALLEKVQTIKESVPFLFKRIKDDVLHAVEGYQERLVEQLVDVERRIAETLVKSRRPDMNALDLCQFTSKFSFNDQPDFSGAIEKFLGDVEGILNLEHRTQAMDVSEGVVWSTKFLGRQTKIINDGKTVQKLQNSRSVVLSSTPLSNGRNEWTVKIDHITFDQNKQVYLGIACDSMPLNCCPGSSIKFWGIVLTTGEKVGHKAGFSRFTDGITTDDELVFTLDYREKGRKMVGTLGLTINGEPVGVAFDCIPPFVYPALSFYFAGDSVSVL